MAKKIFGMKYLERTDINKSGSRPAILIAPSKRIIMTLLNDGDVSTNYDAT